MEEKNERINKIKMIKNKRRNIRIIICSLVLGIIGIATFIGLKNNCNTNYNIFIKTTESRKDSDDIQRKKAINVGKKRFKELGEKVNEDNLEVLKINRKGEYYYYISSKENTLEVRISDNKITRVNSVIVDE